MFCSLMVRFCARPAKEQGFLVQACSVPSLIWSLRPPAKSRGFRCKRAVPSLMVRFCAMHSSKELGWGMRDNVLLLCPSAPSIRKVGHCLLPFGLSG